MTLSYVHKSLVNPKTDTLATSCEELTHWKKLWCWEGLGAGWEGDDRGWDGWMASLTWWTWVWVNSRSSLQGVGDGQGGLACCDSWSPKESDMTERLKWMKMNEWIRQSFLFWMMAFLAYFRSFPSQEYILFWHWVLLLF